MTLQITKGELEAIARAMGKGDITWIDDLPTIEYTKEESEANHGVSGYCWNPATGGNPADNDAMCCELEVNLNWYQSYGGLYELEANMGGHYRTVQIADFPNKQAAKAYASCKVVAAVQLEKEKKR